MKILLSSSKWLYLNCWHFLYTGIKLTFLKPFSNGWHYEERHLQPQKGTVWSGLLSKSVESKMKANLALLPQSIGGRCHLIYWMSGNKSQSHFVELVRKWHAGTNVPLILYCLIGIHVYLGDFKKKLGNRYMTTSKDWSLDRFTLHEN